MKTILLVLIAMASSLAVAAEGGSNPIDVLEFNQAQSQVLSSQIEALTLKQQLQQLQKIDAESRDGQRVPTLVGVLTNAKGSRAEFMDVAGRRSMSIGQAIAPGWRLAEIDKNSVDLIRQGSGVRYRLLMGQSQAEPVRKGD